MVATKPRWAIMNSARPSRYCYHFVMAVLPYTVKNTVAQNVAKVVAQKRFD